MLSNMFFILAPIQVFLVIIIIMISGQKATKETALEFIVSTGVSGAATYGFQLIFHEVVGLIPGLGSFVGAELLAVGMDGW